MKLPGPAGPRRDRALALAFAAGGGGLPPARASDFPREEVFDEVYHAKTALQYLQGENPTEWVHPPTAKLLIAIGVWLFGYEPWAWRLLPALAGIALAPVFYFFARRVLASERAALLASVLPPLRRRVPRPEPHRDDQHLRGAVPDRGRACSSCARCWRSGCRLKGMLLAGLFLGLALSTRWTSLWAWGFLGLRPAGGAPPARLPSARAGPHRRRLRPHPARRVRGELRAVDAAGPPAQRDLWPHTQARSGATTPA